ncbi:MAG: hypothetical protein ABIA04_11865 [Pseudomonadota bacterium]
MKIIKKVNLILIFIVFINLFIITQLFSAEPQVNNREVIESRNISTIQNILSIIKTLEAEAVNKQKDFDHSKNEAEQQEITKQISSSSSS